MLFQWADLLPGDRSLSEKISNRFHRGWNLVTGGGVASQKSPPSG